MKLLVDKDWGSSCIWIPVDGGGWANSDYVNFDLPAEIIARCEYMSDWYEKYDPGTNDPEIDWSSYVAYRLALAIDIKRFFGASAHVYVPVKGYGMSEVTGSFLRMIEPEILYSKIEG